MNTICISLGEHNYLELDNLLKKHTFAEIRLDLAPLSIDEISTLFSKGVQLIATCRPGNYTKDQRMERLKAAIAAGAAYVDIETESDADFRIALISFAKAYPCKVIISYHNFESTPNLVELNQIIKTCKAQGAQLVKLVTTAKNAADSALLLSTYATLTNSDVPLVAFAMGKPGQITRIACIYLGAPFTYASISDAHITAPGQLSSIKTDQIIKLLE